MKRTTRVRGVHSRLLLATAMATILLLAAFGPAAAQRNVELILGHPFPPTHPLHVGLIAPFVEEIRERSDGRIRITVHPGGALAGGAETYEVVVAGGMDIGWALHGYTPGIFPLTEVIEAPFFWQSSEQASRVLWQLYERHEGLQQEYRDVKLLTMWTHDPGDVHTRDRPVRTLEDFRGLRVRAPGPMQFRLLRSFGAVPVGMPAPEIYDSLDRGVIGGVAIAVSGVNSFRLYEVLKHSTVAGLYVAPMYLVMNLDAWNSLSPQDQALFMEVAGGRLAAKGGRIYDVEYDKAVQVMRAHNIALHELPPGELERWRQAAEPIVQEWIAENAHRGAAELYDLMLELAGRK